MSQTPPEDADRGASPVAVKRKPWLSKKLLTATLGGGVGVVAILTVWWHVSPPEAPIKEKLPQQMAVVVPYTAPMIVPTPAAISQPAVPRMVAQPEVQPQPLILPHRDPIAQVATQATVSPPAEPKPHMLSYADPPPPEGTAGQPGAAPGGGAGKSSVKYAATHLDGIQAGLLGDQTFLLTPGLLPCIMDTAINSTLEGPIQCHIPFDVRPHGVTLLGRGSIVHGLYHNNIQEGQARIFVAADWVEDPATGCFIGLGDAPIADPIGQAGIAGSVDQHFMERFGAAILLDVGESGLSLAQAAMSKGGNTYLNFNSGGGVSNVASMILQKQINIPPTITVNQGTPIAVFVNHVLDFSGCYNLELKDRR